MIEISRNSVSDAYRRYAPIYNTLFGKVLAPGRNRMAQKLAVLSPRTILEVGVGTGLALPKYPANSRVVGIDISEEMLAQARRVAAGLPDRRIDLQRMDAETLQFDDGSFDCVTIPYVLSVTPNPDRLVSEARRVCKDGGHIIIVNHFSNSAGWRLFERPLAVFADRIGFRPTFDFERNITSHDWHVISAEPINLFGLSRIVEIRNVSG